jgi:hypothetical protein
VFYLRKIASSNNIIPRYMSIFIYPPRFYASTSSTHITIPPTNLVWNYTKKDNLKVFISNCKVVHSFTSNALPFNW